MCDLYVAVVDWEQNRSIASVFLLKAFLHAPTGTSMEISTFQLHQSLACFNCNIPGNNVQRTPVCLQVLPPCPSAHTVAVSCSL